MEWWTANYSAQGVWDALLKGTSAVTRRCTATPQAVCQSNPFVEQWVGIEPPTLWLLDDHTHHCATANPNTNVKIYEKDTHTNVWEKNAYKCMRKTRIQMYEKKQHTNVWQKHAYKHVYKFMKKTPKNVWKKYTHIMEWLTANYSAQGVWDALLKGTSVVTRR